METRKDRPTTEVHEDTLWARLGKLNFEKDMLISQRDALVVQVAQLQERVRELEVALALKTNAQGKETAKSG